LKLASDVKKKKNLWDPKTRVWKRDKVGIPTKFKGRKKGNE